MGRLRSNVSDMSVVLSVIVGQLLVIKDGSIHSLWAQDVGDGVDAWIFTIWALLYCPPQRAITNLGLGFPTS